MGRLTMFTTKNTLCSALIVLLLFVGGNLANKKKNEEIKKKCDTCRELVKSFKEGMERTARSSFAGGDTDWAEKKLGKYSTSETRLIEITEQLCSKDKNECHAMVEHNEELIETWWTTHQDQDPDLLQWLCMDSLAICCPDNTYGPDCEECPGGIERPCKDHGKCSGGGTRAGTGKCKCNGGYKGDLCDVCKNGFYTEMSNETHTVCTGCDDSCASTCTQAGPTGCKKCKGGYNMEGDKGCQDIDECNVAEPPCKTIEFCQNSPGSYKCTACHMACDQCIGDGPESCVKCKQGFHMVERTCKDIDECETDETCKKDHMFCKNVPGSFLCDCEEGYLSTGDSCVEKTILEGKDPSQLPDPSLSLKDGGDPPAEEAVTEADGTTGKGEVGDEGEAQIVEREARVLRKHEEINRPTIDVKSEEPGSLGDGVDRADQPHQEL